MADQDSVFTDQDMTLEDYRSFSPLALVSFLLSLILSAIAVVNPLLVGLTIPAILLALICIGVSFPHRRRMTGFKLAGLALAIPIASLTAILLFQQLHASHKRSEAIRHADEWLRLVRDGRTHEPFQLMQLRYAREPEGTNLAAALGDARRPGKALESYLRNQPEKDLREDGNAGDLVRQEVLFAPDPVVPKAERYYVEYKYVRPSGEERLFTLVMRRQLYGDDQVFWNVQNVINREPAERRYVYEEGNDRTPSANSDL